MIIDLTFVGDLSKWLSVDNFILKRQRNVFALI